MKLKCLSYCNGLYSLKNCHNQFGKEFQKSIWTPKRCSIPYPAWRYPSHPIQSITPWCYNATSIRGCFLFCFGNVLFTSSSISSSTLSKQSKSKLAMHQELKPCLDLFIDTKALVVMFSRCLSTGSHINCDSRHRFKTPSHLPTLGHHLSPVCMYVLLKDCFGEIKWAGGHICLTGAVASLK